MPASNPAPLNPDTTVAARDATRHDSVHKWLMRAGTAAALAATIGILAAKLLLVTRININWDEFFFLSHVHEAARGEFALLLQGAYVHLFRWLTWLDTQEAGQVVAARLLMWALLAATAVLIWRLARLWVAEPAAAMAPLCYLATSPVLQHGASFRADSLLAPLSVLTLLLLAQQPCSRKHASAAGLCLGVAGVISLKAALFLPALLAFVALARGADGRWQVRATLTTLSTLAVVAGLTAAILLSLHELSLVPSPFTATAHLSQAFAKTVLEVPFFPRASDYGLIRRDNGTVWLLLLAGLLCASVRPRFWRAAACALPLLPLLFYRNAWPYYYVVMLAPASILAAIAVDNLRQFASTLRRASGSPLPTVIASAATVVVALMLSWAACGHITTLWPNRQIAQRATLAAVHRVFPTPVPYIDHSGMIASFHKVNFFMSTWGMETYRATGIGFMEQALAARAPLLLANRRLLAPGSPSSRTELLPHDRELIQKYYQPYWGPIYIAGTSGVVPLDTATRLELPFPGRYRLASALPLVVDGVLHQPGDVIEVSQRTVALRTQARPCPSPCPAVPVRLLWAQAKAPPPLPPPSAPLYTPLRM